MTLVNSQTFNVSDALHDCGPKMFPKLIFTTFSFFFFLSLIAQMSIQAFKVISLSSNTHHNITRAAVLKKSAEACRTHVLKQGGNFIQPNPLTAESLAKACLSPASASMLKSAIRVVSIRNAWVDGKHVLNAEYHFDDESFEQARNLITQGVSLVKASLKLKNYEYARQRLGETLHTLQDFYSHSNWIELGNRSPYSTLIKPSLPFENLADVNTPTCSSCGGDCTGNILDTIITQKKLTSGYFSLTSPSKPKGKCSHGGFFDLTSRVEPKGGINKDGATTAHGSLHFVAADVATAATGDLLQDIREEAGDVEFLRLMGISKSSSVLCFVVDTSVTMTEEIAEVKHITSFIIDSRRGTADEPSAYVLVPFSNSGFGPVDKTTDPDVFKAKVNALSAGGKGADDLEMSLSGLWLALAAAPVASEIFLFTDGEPKDPEMKSTVLALIESTKSTVNFVLTNPLTNRTRSLSNPVNQVYEDLAVASGGLAIEVPNQLLSNTTSAINDTSVSSLVTIFQAVRDPGTAEHFSFAVDSSVKNLTFYITGNSTQFTITAPSGQSQSSGQPDGSLAVIQSVVNFHMVQIKNSSQPGEWLIYMNSTQPYTLKVTGKSSINFQFDFVEVYQTPHPGYTVFKSRPRANGNVTLLLSILGSGSEVPTTVRLVEASGSGFYTGLLEDVGNGDYLVTVTTVPKGEFFVRVNGQINSSSTSDYNVFQRQSSTRHRASNISVTAVRNETWFPGQLFRLPFTVTTNNSYSNYIVTARNSGQYNMTFPSSLTTGSDSTANGVVVLSAPDNTTDGTEVILTIEVTQSGTNDTNYSFLRLAVSRAVAPPAGLALSLWLSAVTLLISLVINK
ncbi:von Willebrand factor A domain-containing protein 7-like [Colossoma macropomum]|uniref:von Willebrand factor A domain-containing protein 7-like n=1 Tax=Colossoma macropomum TaxID=42526 RepID=UPI00186517A3|nr:von Willebrand factor A domain-containing protein 7-like [Colossoma macropomum]